MVTKTSSIKAIQLVRQIFEFVHGNLGILKFNIEELSPINGEGGEESKKWKVICSFYETLGSSSPSRYEAIVDLTDNTVIFKRISGEVTSASRELEGLWRKEKPTGK